MTKLYNLKQFTAVRKKLRNQSHDVVCEKLLWRKIRRNQLGFKFRRQYGIGKYVVDFYCRELKLAVEIDGPTHDEQREATDQQRQQFIENIGVIVRRYQNYDVKNNLAGVEENLRELCEGLSRNTPP